MSQKTGGVLGGILGDSSSETEEGESPPATEDAGAANRIDKFAYGIFGNYFKSKKNNYAGYRKKINQARMEVGYDMYLSRISLYSVITGIVGALLGILLTWVLARIGVTQGMSAALDLPPALQGFVSQYRTFIIGFFLTVILAAVLGGIAGGILYYVPSFKAGERKRQIDATLPYAVTFMYALSRGGMNVLEVMEKLSNAEDVYGEVANEFDMILRDMDYFGNDLRIALRNASDMTPSENLSDFVDDLLSVIDSGGEITPFMLNKSQQYHEIRKQDQKGFLDTLALMSESYVTAFVAAPLFIIIITTIMAVMGGANMMQLYAIIYLVLPLASMGFAFVIDIIAGSGEGSTEQLETQRNPFQLEDVEEMNEASDDDRLEDLIKAKKLQGTKDFIRDPLAKIRQEPLLTLGATVPVALLFIVFAWYFGYAQFSITAFFETPVSNTIYTAIIPLLITTLPLSYYHEKKQRRNKKVIRELPETLKKLSSANETGMTLDESLLLVSKTSSGILAGEFKKVHNEIQWDTGLNDALIGFANRMRIPRLSRTMKLITKANESSGNVQEVLEVAARDVDTAYKLDRERFQNMIIYTVIILISFLVFLFVIVILERQFLTVMAEEAAGFDSGGAGGSGFSIEEVPIEKFRMVFFHAAVIQGFASGLVAGQMGEGNVLSGLKYGIVMMVIATVVFLFI
ncbi:MAG: type II secretion system F family protein [Halobacteriales archaeon]|nr:type II secretion system F family protein [Halobacteriales archaeon]